MIEVLFWLSVSAVFYHHIVYPLLLGALARIRANRPAPGRRDADGPLPFMSVVMPTYNEAGFIAGKIGNLLALDYPRDRLRIVIACDGSSDGTPDIARRTLAEHGAAADIVTLLDIPENRGKVATLNAVIPDCDGNVLVLTDVSADLPADALLALARHFRDEGVGTVGGGYELAAAGCPGEAAYWRFQSALKKNEALVGAPMGMHGAFYAIRRTCWRPLAADTINDDFIMPMRVVAEGRRAVYDPAIAVVERELTQRTQEWRRRVRIGAGNVQQVVRCWRLADPRRPSVAFVFLSGKALRAAMPSALAMAALASIALAASQGGFWSAAAAAQALFYGTAIVGLAARRLTAPLARRASTAKILAWPAYFIEGYAAAAVGAFSLLNAFTTSLLNRTGFLSTEESHVQPLAQIGKRTLDLVVASVVLLVLGALFVPIALAIRLESKGPILYRQLRVGRTWRDRTDLFHLIKFRSMRVDAEASSGAVWASTRDPRITAVGGFLRKTRLDELPQCINVLRGEMSVVGPRPERPVFFPRLEGEIPFYAERTVALRPGITGLAQVNNRYDATMDDVRTKVLFDHAYAVQIASPMRWLRTDFGIMLKTFTVMVTGKGQ